MRKKSAHDYREDEGRRWFPGPHDARTRGHGHRLLLVHPRELPLSVIVRPVGHNVALEQGSDGKGWYRVGRRCGGDGDGSPLLAHIRLVRVVVAHNEMTIPVPAEYPFLLGAARETGCDLDVTERERFLQAPILLHQEWKLRGELVRWDLEVESVVFSSAPSTVKSRAAAPSPLLKS